VKVESEVVLVEIREIKAVLGKFLGHPRCAETSFPFLLELVSVTKGESLGQ
jgi:hypothetical protein